MDCCERNILAAVGTGILIRFREALHFHLKISDRALSLVVEFKTIHRTIDSGAFIFITNSLLRCDIFVIAEVGGSLTEHLAVKELLCVLDLRKVFVVAVTHQGSDGWQAEKILELMKTVY